MKAVKKFYDHITKACVSHELDSKILLLIKRLAIKFLGLK